MTLKLHNKDDDRTDRERADDFSEATTEAFRELEGRLQQLCREYGVPLDAHPLTDPSPATMPGDDLMNEFLGAVGRRMGWPDE